MANEYGICKFCGAKNVKSPKTGKIFCSEKCWLKNKPDDTGSFPSPKQPFRKQEPNWDKIRAEKTENIEFLNAKNVAGALLSAAIQAGRFTFEEALDAYEKTTQKIYDTGRGDKPAN